MQLIIGSIDDISPVSGPHQNGVEVSPLGVAWE